MKKTIKQVKQESTDYAESILELVEGVENYDAMVLATIKVASSILFAAGQRKEAVTLQSMHELIEYRIKEELKGK